MDDARVDAHRPDVVDAFGEALRLDLEVERLGIIRGRVVGEHALEDERTVEVDLPQELEHVIVTHADAVHSRVDGQMVRGDHPVPVGLLSVCDGEVGLVDRRDDVVAEQERDARDRRLRQEHDGSRDAGFAQRDRLCDLRDRQPIGSGPERGLRDLVSAMSVGVGGHDRRQTRARLEVAAYFRDVVADRRQIDFDPCPTLLVDVHRLELLGIEWDRIPARRLRVSGTGSSTARSRGKRSLSGCRVDLPALEDTARLVGSRLRRLLALRSILLLCGVLLAFGALPANGIARRFEIGISTGETREPVGQIVHVNPL